MWKARFLCVIIFTAGMYLVFRTPTMHHYFGLKCKIKEANLSKIPMIKTALASYPGSGNTWLRHLIQQVTGIATGSIYCDTTLRKTFIGECVENTSTIVIKTHDRQPESTYQRAVIIIRSPFRCFSSQFNFRYTRNHTGVASGNAYQDHFKDYLGRFLPRWKQMNQAWMIYFEGPKYVIFYDKLIKHQEEEMRKLMYFLGVQYDEKDFQCMLKNCEGTVHRKSIKQKHILPYFTPEQFTQTMKDILHIEQIAETLNGKYHKIDLYV